MSDTNLPFSTDVINLLEKNSEKLAVDFKQYLKENNKFYEFEVNELYPINGLKDILSEQFNSFNIDKFYTREIENANFSDSDKKNYYDNLFNFTIPKALRK